MSDVFTSRTMTDLGKIGIEDPWALLLNVPKHYDDFTVPLKSVPAIMRLEIGTSFYASLKLVSVATSQEIDAQKKALGQPARAGTGEYVNIELTDGMRSLKAMVFGRVKPWEQIRKDAIGQIIHISGKLSQDKRNPQFKVVNNLEIVPSSDRNRIVSRYGGRDGVITPGRVADLTKTALLHFADEAVDQILNNLGVPEQTVMQHCRIPFNDLKHLLMTLHIPRTPQDLERAMKSARRMNAYFGIRKALEATTRKPVPESAIPVDRELIRQLVDQHPFTPTKDQRLAIWDMICDLASETPMDRLLSADVGNGKTMAYGIPAAYAASKGKNVVILLPTEPLAGQVEKNIRTWYPQLKVHLVTAGFNGLVEQGSILVGTTAILAWLDKHPDWKVDFAVTDEQQKMGTVQRESLNNLGTHILEATATPIPRTMAQALFGNKKITLIDDCPVVKKISTKLVGNTLSEKRNAMDILYKTVADGGRVAVIYPLVAEKMAYVYHAKVETLKEAEKIGSAFKKLNFQVKSVKAAAESDDIVSELSKSVCDGFVIELHGEEQAHTRLLKRFERALGEHCQVLEFLGERIDEDLALKNKKTIIQGAEKWEKIKPNRVAVIHGRSKRDEKVEIIDLMNRGDADVLLATTLIEIGIDIADLRALAVIDADYLGAYTLHQLRGRVARNGGNGFFVMMASAPIDELDEKALDRLNLLVKFTRGSDIALHDMEQRGFGNLDAGGKAQKGFDDGLFSQLKLSPKEMDAFLADFTKEMKEQTKPAGWRQAASAPTP
ncbi:DEAD/DEAH box helicase [Pseudomonas fluorescens]|uniref:DEAD/DEAH box helicase n=1 Tax=Pseudomonas TaxID=286 RepID=UPI000F0382CD|nr:MULTISPECIES: DEAD/DEAH box helicase [Pseudomonas]MBD8089284.1 DEAD/DEAH box helicase [Pseudomonas fluorescens]MBD8615289.1 DEAD/DEAH box helicase [Pseudomonas putida]MBD8682057.1 DEAD/DEAH box helicase [Pseudomonas sp. CFBP 13719]